VPSGVFTVSLEEFVSQIRCEKYKCFKDKVVVYQPWRDPQKKSNKHGDRHFYDGATVSFGFLEKVTQRRKDTSPTITGSSKAAKPSIIPEDIPPLHEGDLRAIETPS
jgi:hypothetical protein